MAIRSAHVQSLIDGMAHVQPIDGGNAPVQSLTAWIGSAQVADATLHGQFAMLSHAVQLSPEPI